MNIQERINHSIRNLQEGVTGATRGLQEWKRDLINRTFTIDKERSSQFSPILLPNVVKLSNKCYEVMDEAERLLESKEFTRIVRMSARGLLRHHDNHMKVYKTNCINYLKVYPDDNRFYNPVNINSNPVIERADYGLQYLSIVNLLSRTASGICSLIDSVGGKELPSYKWCGSNVEFAQLAQSLYLSKKITSIDGGEVSAIELTNVLGNLVGASTKDFYNTLNGSKDRNKVKFDEETFLLDLHNHLINYFKEEKSGSK